MCYRTVVWALLTVGLRLAYAQGAESANAKLRDAKPEAIIAALGCGDVFTREGALAQIARGNRSPELTRLAADALATVGQPGVKAQLIAVLAERGDPSVAPAVRKALADSDPSVRAAAAVACGLLKDVKAADTLFGMLGGEQGGVAYEALRRIPGRSIDAHLVTLLRKGEAAQRVMAVELLSARRYDGLFPLLLDKRLFVSGDAALAKAVAGAIRSCTPSGCFEKLLAFALSLPAPSAELLVGTLSVTLDEAADKPACVRRLAQTLTAGDAAYAPLLAGLLAASQSSEALRVLSGRLACDDLEVRKEAMRHLGKWNSEAALVPLVLAARRERDAGAQTLAWRAVIDIANRPDKIADFYQPLSALQQAMWHAPRLEEKVAALKTLPCYSPKAGEAVDALLTKTETENPELAAEARTLRSALLLNRAPSPFFAMDTGLRDGVVRTPAEQARLLRELGYAGVGWGPDQIPEMLAALDAEGLKMFNVYVGVEIGGTNRVAPENVLRVLGQLKGRETTLWLYVTSKRFTKASDEAGDADAVAMLRDIADRAQQAGLKVSLYPHTWFWMERVQDAVRLVRKVNRLNLGVTFNLCHCIKVGDAGRTNELLEQAKPYLTFVTVNGADAEGGWDRLIQPLGQGTFDVAAVLKTLRAMDYRGPVGLQHYGIKGDSREKLGQSMAGWRALQAEK